MGFRSYSLICIVQYLRHPHTPESNQRSKRQRLSTGSESQASGPNQPGRSTDREIDGMAIIHFLRVVVPHRILERKTGCEHTRSPSTIPIKEPESTSITQESPQTTLYLPAVAVGLRISACKAAADASISNLLISRTACSTCGIHIKRYPLKQC